jgi:response regulator of citrate/malate metabolism
VTVSASYEKQKRKTQAETVFHKPAVREQVADSALIQRIVKVLEAAGEPLMIGEVARRAGISRPTASKYVEICEALRLVESERYATARRVSLRAPARSRRGGSS